MHTEGPGMWRLEVDDIEIGCGYKLLQPIADLCSAGVLTYEIPEKCYNHG